MRTRYFSLIYGVVFLIVGILGFVPSLVMPPAPGAPPLAVGAYYGNLFGLFPVNVLHNLIHLVIGLWGIASWRTFGPARGYARSVTVIFAVIAVFGLIPGLSTLFGLVPFYSNDIWLHAAAALIAAYFGWAAVPAAAPAAGEHR